MTPMQTNKEIVFNEAILKLDGFCNAVIKSFVAEIPSQYEIGDKYILSEGENRNNICYIFAEASGWQQLQPKKGMIFFCEQLGETIFFNGQNWLPISSLNSSSRFLGINNTFAPNANDNYLCLYLRGNTTIDISNVHVNKITMIIKQNFEIPYAVSWGGQILWPNRNSHQITQNINNFDVLEFYRLYETDHFIAKIVGVNYQY
jgi:hypothetical protein